MSDEFAGGRNGSVGGVGLSDLAPMDVPPLTIRSLSECPGVAGQIASWHWREWGGDTVGETLEDWSNRVASRAGSVGVPFTLVGFVGGVPVGAVSVCWDDADRRFSGVGPWVSGIVVRSEARNLGVGRALLRAAEDRCRELGYERVWLHTGEARRFYARMGWQLEADKSFPDHDAVLSKRLVDDAQRIGLRSSDGVLVVAHRGASTECPENTMPAFDRAIDLGAHVIEFDVQPTSDGQLVVIHDLTLDRTTNGHGPVFRSTFDEIRGLDAGSWFDPAFAGTCVPTLVEVLELDGSMFELELKGYGEAFVDAVLETVRSAGVLDRVEFTGSNPLLVGMLRRKERRAVTGLFSAPRQPWMSGEVYEHHVVGTAATSGAAIAHVYAQHLTPAIADRLHALGMQVHANDAASSDEVRRAIDAGADRVSIGDVAVAIDLAARVADVDV
ncbi:MAG: GNAT family N-acetyltransferase [Ilumatobacteraceae bacterium]